MNSRGAAGRGAKRLRRRAERLILAGDSGSIPFPQMKAQTLAHELQVHQVELEMQNEELHRTQIELAESRDRYSDLYEFAPVGYVTLDPRGRIFESNLTNATILGVNRRDLKGTYLSSFVAPESRSDFHFYLRAVFDSNTKRACELTMKKKDGVPLRMRLESITRQSDVPETRRCRTALIDVTDAHITQQTLTEQSARLEQYKKDLQVMSAEMMLTEARERQQLAEDLHDNLGQALFRARMKLDRTPLNSEAVAEIRAILKEMSGRVSTLTYELHPVLLPGMDFWSRLQWLAKNLKEKYGLHVRFKGPDPGIALDENISVVVFRSVREVLINVAKHAKTNFASLSASQAGRKLAINIRDSGKGFNLRDRGDSVRKGHYGLFSIRERLEYLGGSLKISSAPGKGTVVTVTVPCKIGS